MTYPAGMSRLPEMLGFAAGWMPARSRTKLEARSPVWSCSRAIPSWWRRRVRRGWRGVSGPLPQMLGNVGRAQSAGQAFTSEPDLGGCIGDLLAFIRRRGVDRGANFLGYPPRWSPDFGRRWLIEEGERPLGGHWGCNVHDRYRRRMGVATQCTETSRFASGGITSPRLQEAHWVSPGLAGSRPPADRSVRQRGSTRAARQTRRRCSINFTRMRNGTARLGLLVLAFQGRYDMSQHVSVVVVGDKIVAVGPPASLPPEDRQDHPVQTSEAPSISPDLFFTTRKHGPQTH